jgi:hypothetical protein
LGCYAGLSHHQSKRRADRHGDSSAARDAAIEVGVRFIAVIREKNDFVEVNRPNDAVGDCGEGGTTRGNFATKRL